MLLGENASVQFATSTPVLPRVPPPPPYLFLRRKPWLVGDRKHRPFLYTPTGVGGSVFFDPPWPGKIGVGQHRPPCHHLAALGTLILVCPVLIGSMFLVSFAWLFELIFFFLRFLIILQNVLRTLDCGKCTEHILLAPRTCENA